MGGCQNYGPFFGYPKYKVPCYNGDPKRDHNFDNHPHVNVNVGIRRKADGSLIFSR